MSDARPDTIAAMMAVVSKHHHGDVYGRGTAYERPFVMHCMEVAELAFALYPEADLDVPRWAVTAAGLAHDVIEDSPYGREEAARDVLAAGGPVVFDMVERVTDVEASSRKESKALTLPLIAGSPAATFVKICDRLANQRATIAGNTLRFARLYADEYDDFRSALHSTLPVASLWSRLDEQRDRLLEIVITDTTPPTSSAIHSDGRPHALVASADDSTLP